MRWGFSTTRNPARQPLLRNSFMNVNVTISLDPKLQSLLESLGGGNQIQLSRIESKLDSIQTGVTKILMTEQELTTLLTNIDTTTNAIAANVDTIAKVDAQISTEIDTLLKSVQPGTPLTDAQIAQLQGFSAKLQATSDASTAQVAVLQGIAAKAAPVVPPPPPPPTV